MFDEKIKFKFPWRPYQERVLKETEKYIKDKKIHIVAAPGSGKTVLGIELARRLKSPVIIFSPTVTIKNQWIDRFITSFTDFKEIPDWVSNNIYDLKFFNVATYQALHYVYKRKNIKVEDEEETDDVITDLNDNVVENVKVNEYDIISEIQKKNIKTIILDEAHHLKSEWWNSLNKVLNSLEDITIISLTATPPYDSEASEWKKYISLCGEIDAEISVPELVKVNNLCPHQDYIFFNKPTKEEKIELSKYENELKNKIEEIKRDDKLLNSIKNHKYILKPNYYEEELLENVEYYSSMLIYLNYRNEVINKNNLNIIGAKSKIPELTDEWLEILLKNLVLLDRENHDEGVVSKYEKEFRKLGVLDKNKFSFSDNKLLQKCFLNSLGKLNSISEIVKVESESLKEELRMVILTDFIRKEYMEAETEANKLGVFSIFNKLSKEYPKMNIAILTGTIFVIPKSKEKKLHDLCFEKGIETDKIKYSVLSSNENYSVINIPNLIRNKVMSMISELFANGQINIIIGTKSLLGEGWDEPSINSLILASFVGSFMLSNQMRGRAIRTNKNPKKTANIWHLVCVNDDRTEINTDINILTRRFDSFVGIDQSGNVVESGIERMGNIVPPYTESKIEELNYEMCKQAINREKMYNDWKNALYKMPVKSRMNTEIEIVQKEVARKDKIKNALIGNKKTIILTVIFLILLLVALLDSSIVPPILKLIEVIIGIYLAPKLYRLLRLSKTKNFVCEVAKVTLNALCRSQIIKTSRGDIELKVKEVQKGKISCYITGGTEKESLIFADSLEEVFEKTENQRYIIAKLNDKLEEVNLYYNVPNILATNKDFAVIFSQYWNVRIGKYELIYTRTAKGRKMLLKARMKNMTLKDKVQKKQVYSAFK